jgi:hypothetical protein
MADSDEEYDLSEEKRDAKPPPTPLGRRSDTVPASAAVVVTVSSEPPLAAAGSAPVPAAGPPPLPPKPRGRAATPLQRQNSSPTQLSGSLPALSAVGSVLEDQHSARSSVDDSSNRSSNSKRSSDERGSNSKPNSVRMKGEKKQNRVSQLLERLHVAPRGSSSRSSAETDELVVSGPIQFQHRAHGETGLVKLVHPSDDEEEKAQQQTAMKRGTALWPFVAKFENEISLEAGELVVCFVVQEDEDWWKGMNTKKEWGWFPKNLIHLTN